MKAQCKHTNSNPTDCVFFACLIPVLIEQNGMIEIHHLISFQSADSQRTSLFLKLKLFFATKHHLCQDYPDKLNVLTWLRNSKQSRTNNKMLLDEMKKNII
ncbi:hypothetical protein XENOCAPTIV_004615 [Xenoophorus captivus]|uniref:Uncharacterized protein n=1 Tax=Xenoophorus captivus TaxID=1517983 RepID=A0ABV0Q809_9TELE